MVWNGFPVRHTLSILACAGVLSMTRSEITSNSSLEGREKMIQKSEIRDGMRIEWNVPIETDVPPRD